MGVSHYNLFVLPKTAYSHEFQFPTRTVGNLWGWKVVKFKINPLQPPLTEVQWMDLKMPGFILKVKCI